LAILSFIAYVLGALYVPASNSMLAGLSRAGRSGFALDHATEQSLRDYLHRRLRDKSWLDPERDIEGRIIHELLGEFDALIVKLQVLERNDLYQAYDRNRSEAELRAGIAIPLLALIYGIGIDTSRWFLWAFPAPLLLVYPATGKAKDATRVVSQAVIAGVIPSSTLQNLDIDQQKRESAAREARGLMSRDQSAESAGTGDGSLGGDLDTDTT
jgi:hypothetical protein